WATFTLCLSSEGSRLGRLLVRTLPQAQVGPQDSSPVEGDLFPARRVSGLCPGRALRSPSHEVLQPLPRRALRCLPVGHAPPTHPRTHAPTHPRTHAPTHPPRFCGHHDVAGTHINSGS